MVGRPHGLKGELKLHPYNPFTETFDALEYLYLRSPGGEIQKFIIEQLRPFSGDFLVVLEGIADRNGSERVRGFEVLIEECQLQPCKEGEYYWFQLIGLKAVLESGEYVGEVVRLEETNPRLGGHDLLVIKSRGREVMAPFISRVVKEVDLAGGRIVVIGIKDFMEK